MGGSSYWYTYQNQIVEGLACISALLQEEPLNTASFAIYLEQVLGPGLQPGDVVVLDNLQVHEAAGLAELVEARGARLLYLPPYSPDFTPIELAFSKLKTHLRTAAARTREVLTTALQGALAWITAEDALAIVAIVYTDYEFALTCSATNVQLTRQARRKAVR